MKNPQHPILFELIHNLVIEGIKKVVTVSKTRTYRPSYFKYPRISYRDNELPELSTGMFSSGPPVQYEDYFGSYTEAPSELRLEDLVGYQEIISYLSKDESYRKIFGMPGENKELEIEMNLVVISINKHLKELISRSIHTYGDEFELSKGNFLKLYLPIEKCIYSDELFIDFYIPILFLKFDFDFFRINEQISIVKMDETFQLSRISINSHQENIKESILSSATHAVVIENYIVKNDNYYIITSLLSNPSSYPMDIVDYIFNSLRMVINEPTGYAQVLTLPIGWTDGYKADLLNLKGFSINAYPPEFNKLDRLTSQIPIISERQLDKLVTIYSDLKEQVHKKIQLAYKRLESCYFRTDERDIIIDAVIGLEALLSDSDKGEITHKLSMRIAFLLQKSQLNQSKIEIFKNMKSIYSFRSLIVHGDPNWEKKRIIQLESSESISTAQLAVLYLKECILVITKNTEYTNAKLIDEKMILST